MPAANNTNHSAGQATGIMDRDERSGAWKAGSCSVCTLPSEQLLALNLLLADPRQWPKNTFAGIRLPRGALPAGYRLWGAIKTAAVWCAEQDPPILINHKAIRRHYNNHVVQLPSSAVDFAETAMLSEQDSRLAKPMIQIASTPLQFREYFAKGIDIGLRALDMLEEQLVDAQLSDTYVSPDMLMDVANLAAKLSSNAAALVQRGMEMEKEKEDELAGFRAGNQPVPSARMGHHRIRVIDGEARPVVDEGRADRREYNESAREQGNPTLPA